MKDKKEKCTFPEFQMNNGCAECPIATCSGKKDKQPDPKPLAQYLFEYDCEHADIRSSREYFQQALETYQSTENVTIKIERKYDG